MQGIRLTCLFSLLLGNLKIFFTASNRWERRWEHLSLISQGWKITWETLHGKKKTFFSLRPPLYGIPTIFQTDHKSVHGWNCWGGFFKWASLQTFNFLLCVSQRSWTILQPTISKKSQFMCLNHFQGWTVGTVCFLNRWAKKWGVCLYPALCDTAKHSHTFIL